MAKNVYYVGKKIIASVKDTEGRVIHLENEKIGIIGMAPVFEKLGKARAFLKCEPIEMVIKSADRR